MQYRLDMGAWSSVFAVPTELVDRHLRLATKEALQVILWVFRHGGENFSPETLSPALGIPEESCQEALEYWVQEGLLCQVGETFMSAEKPAYAESSKETENSGDSAENESGDLTPKKLPPRQRLVRPDNAYLSKRIKESETIRTLFSEVEQILGVLSTSMSHVILMACDDYGLPPEVILMLVNYAKDNGKVTTPYIESMVRDWSAEEIFTLDAAEKKLRDLSEHRRAWNLVCSVAGIERRSPTKKEEEASYRWVVEWGFTKDMLVEAYERCANRLGKFNISYMNKVLTNWHAAGIRNPAQIEQFDQKKKPGGDKSYNIEDINQISSFDIPEDL